MVSPFIHSLRYISVTGRPHHNARDRSRAHWDHLVDLRSIIRQPILHEGCFIDG